jgi:iron(III) transport system ATP-binding protein
MNAAQHASSALLEISNINVSYSKQNIVKNVSLDIQPGEIGCLLGPSGCGKSTLLRAIAGFEPVQQGTISLKNKLIASQSITVPPEKRCIGMVFQDISLFPHLSIEENICFGIKKLTKKAQHARAAQLLDLIDLTEYANAYPHELSGGQQQRVALARALAPKPQLILLDEPFSGLDAKLKETLVPQVRSILKQEQISALMVSHDQSEAFAISDKIAVMKCGEIHQWASPYRCYHQPATKFIASFIGKSAFLPAITTCDTCIETDLGNLRSDEPHGYQTDEKVCVLVRIDDVKHDPNSNYVGTVTNKNFHGSYFTYEVMIAEGTSVLCSTPAHYSYKLEVGDPFGLKLNIEHLVLFER